MFGLNVISDFRKEFRPSPREALASTGRGRPRGALRRLVGPGALPRGVARRGGDRGTRSGPAVGASASARRRRLSFARRRQASEARIGTDRRRRSRPHDRAGQRRAASSPGHAGKARWPRSSESTSIRIRRAPLLPPIMHRCRPSATTNTSRRRANGATPSALQPGNERPRCEQLAVPPLLPPARNSERLIPSALLRRRRPSPAASRRVRNWPGSWCRREYADCPASRSSRKCPRPRS